MRGRYASREWLATALAGAYADDAPATVAAAVRPPRLSLRRVEYGEFIGCNAGGYLGQHLVICPEKGLIAVRLVESSAANDAGLDAFQERVHVQVP